MEKFLCESCGMPYPKMTDGNGTLTQLDADRLRTHADWYQESVKHAVRACAENMMGEWQLRDLANRIERALK